MEAHRRAEAQRILAREGLRIGPTPRRRSEPKPTSASAVLERDLNDLVAETVGADRAFFQVRVQLDLDRVSSRSLRYGRRGVPLVVGRETERLRSDVARRDRAFAAVNEGLLATPGAQAALRSGPWLLLGLGILCPLAEIGRALRSARSG